MVLLTDSEEVYAQHDAPKILTDGFVILSSTLLSDEKIAHFNAKLNGIENEAARLMIAELEEVCTHFPTFRTHRFLETRQSNYDKAYSLLYPNFKDFVTKKFLIELLVERLISELDEPTTFAFNLSQSYRSLAFSELGNEEGLLELRSTPKSPEKRLLRDIFYRTETLKRRFKKQPVRNQKYRIGLFIFDTINDTELFETFFELVKNDKDVHLDIVQMESGIAPDKVSSAQKYAGENINVYKLQDFRAPLIDATNDFERVLTQHYPQYAHFVGTQHNRSNATYTAFIDAALKTLQPQTVLYDNTGEVGRYLSDVARYYGIKSANVEYGLFSNDFIHMASNICYDVRFCLGEASVATWKDKKDPSLKHVPIGFIKLDHSEQISAQGDDFSWTANNNFEQLIFFASTWAGTNSLYNIEKTAVVKELSARCKANNWGLIIKKHPAESDTLLDQLDEIKADHVFLYQHHEAQLFQLLNRCDIVCTQNSSITVEALLHGKPTVFYNKSEQEGLAELVPMSQEPFVFFVHDSAGFEQVVKHSIPLLDKVIYTKSLNKYLYKTDQNASFRLLDELKHLCE